MTSKNTMKEETIHLGDVAWCECGCHVSGETGGKCKKCYAPTTPEGWEEEFATINLCDCASLCFGHEKLREKLKSFISKVEAQAELRGEEKGRKITEERVELANNGYLCPNCYSTEHKYCGIPVKVGNPFASLTQEKGKKK